MKLEKINNNDINIFQKYYLPKNQEEDNKKIDYLDYSSFLSTANKKQERPKRNIKKTNIFTKMFYNYIIPYLSPKDLIAFKLCNKITNNFISKKAISICIISKSTKNFFSFKERQIIWSYYLKLDKYKFQLFQEDKNKFIFDILDEQNNNSKDKEILYYNIAVKLIEMIKVDEKNEKLKKIYNEKEVKSIKDSIEYIRRDVNRTFHTDYFTKGEGRIQLKRVLESMCTVKGNVGYCQGMNFILGAMIYLLQNEVSGFYMFNCMLNSYELNTLFAYNTPDYGIRVFQLNYYVKKYLIEVYNHFKNNNLSFDLLYSDWLLTLFSNYFDIEKLDFPWTCFIVDKWKGLIKICLIIIYELKYELMKCNMETLTILIKEKKFKNNFSNFIDLYRNKFKVTNNQLRELKTEYYSNLVKKKLEETNTQLDKWEEDQKQPLIEYLNEKNKIENNVMKDIETYKILNEESIKKYLLVLKKNNELMKYVNSLKSRINELATIKYDYEELFEYYKKALKQNEDNTKQNKSQKDNIRNILENEKNNLLEKYMQVKGEFMLKNEILYRQCDIIDEFRKEIKKCENEKNKRKQQMQDYIFLVEKKQDELIKNLIDKLKLSSIFKKTNKF